MKTKQEIEATLPGFTGTESYTRLHYPWCKPVLLTDGVKYLVDACESYWLIDVIASHQQNAKVKGEGFQVWRVYVTEDKRCAIKCDDGNRHDLVSQFIPWTSFPLSEISLYVVEQGNEIVVMLPSEY